MRLGGTECRGPCRLAWRRHRRLKDPFWRSRRHLPDHWLRRHRCARKGRCYFGSRFMLTEIWRWKICVWRRGWLDATELRGLLVLNRSWNCSCFCIDDGNGINALIRKISQIPHLIPPQTVHPCDVFTPCFPRLEGTRMQSRDMTSDVIFPVRPIISKEIRRWCCHTILGPFLCFLCHNTIRRT